MTGGTVRQAAEGGYRFKAVAQSRLTSTCTETGVIRRRHAELDDPIVGTAIPVIESRLLRLGVVTPHDISSLIRSFRLQKRMHSRQKWLDLLVSLHTPLKKRRPHKSP